MLAFAAVCLACGLYFFADLADEFTSLTKRIIWWTIIVELALHAALLIFERFPLFPTLLGVAAHAMYLLLLRSFPFVNVMSPLFIVACTLFIVSLVAWFLFFSANHELFYANHLTPGYSVAFFYVVLVFLVPTALFVGLTVNESQLPSALFQEPTSQSSNMDDAARASLRHSPSASSGGVGLRRLGIGSAAASRESDAATDGLGDPALLHKKRRNLLSSVAHLASYYVQRLAEFLPNSRQRRRARGNVL